MAPSLDLPRVEYVRPRSGLCLCCEAAERGVLNNEGLLSKSTPSSDIDRGTEN